MSVLLVTVVSDDDLNTSSHEHLYRQIKTLQYPYSSHHHHPFSIAVQSKSDQRRRHSRPQQCLVKHLLTLMITLLFLINHLHWSMIFLSISSFKFMSTYASITPSNSSFKTLSSFEQQCLILNSSSIDRICSKTCRAQRTPFDQLDRINQYFLDSHYLPFCSNHSINHSINRENLSRNLTENQCREIIRQLITFDEEARKTSRLFTTYMQAIDSASPENRYSLIESDCHQAYRTWACSVKIPYFHQNRLIPPCQTICDEVERVCPTFRPSDREPLFAGQPLFFCNGGLLTNSDYGQRPYCFDTCHLRDDSSTHHSVSKKTTTARCFEIDLFSSSSSSSSSSTSMSFNESSFNRTSNASISSSAISIISLTWWWSSSSIFVNLFTLIIIFPQV